MNAIVIERGSPAWIELFAAMYHPGIDKVSLDARGDGIAVKANEYMWSPTLRTGQAI